jgi:hypothetical protein
MLAAMRWEGMLIPGASLKSQNVISSFPPMQRVRVCRVAFLLEVLHEKPHQRS